MYELSMIVFAILLPETYAKSGQTADTLSNNTGSQLHGNRVNTVMKSRQVKFSRSDYLYLYNGRYKQQKYTFITKTCLAQKYEVKRSRNSGEGDIFIRNGHGVA